MTYDLNSYFSSTERNKGSRVEVYPNRDVAGKLLAQYKNDCFRVVSIMDCVDATSKGFGKVDVVEAFRRLDEEITDASEPIVVVGLDALLAIRPENERKALTTILKKRVDASHSPDVAYLLHWRYFDEKAFSNERYKQSGKIAIFAGYEEELESPTIEVVSPDWIPNRKIEGYETVDSPRELYDKLDDYCPTGKYLLRVAPPRGKNYPNVIFHRNAREVLKRFYQIDVELSDDAIKTLLTNSVKLNEEPEEYLVGVFGADNLKPAFAPDRLHALRSYSIWNAFVWLCSRKVKDSPYLDYVLESGATSDDFMRKYVCDCVLELLSDGSKKLPNSVQERERLLNKMAKERASVVKSLADADGGSYVSDFVSLTRGNSAALRFLNCGRKAEQVEIIRLMKNENLDEGVPERYRDFFPALDMYLASNGCYPNAEIADYFAEYRRLKAQDEITDAFIERAFQGYDLIDNSIEHRESALAKYANMSSDELTTIVVDAMGAEYLPLLMDFAKKNNLPHEDYRLVRANLPTSTEFNPIDEQKYHTLSVKGLDNIAHDGAMKHETSGYEENLYAALKVFDDLFSKIKAALKTSSKDEEKIVVVTADHGSTRLAKLAYERRRELVCDLESSGEKPPTDWRYDEVDSSAVTPEEVVRTVSNEKTYWVARGYRRFSKSGGKKNELHGGATLEEILVPFVVFTSNPKNEMRERPQVVFQETPKQEKAPDADAQFTEDPAFDDI